MIFDRVSLPAPKVRHSWQSLNASDVACLPSGWHWGVTCVGCGREIKGSAYEEVRRVLGYAPETREDLDRYLVRLNSADAATFALAYPEKIS